MRKKLFLALQIVLLTGLVTSCFAFPASRDKEEVEFFKDFPSPPKHTILEANVWQDFYGARHQVEFEDEMGEYEKEEKKGTVWELLVDGEQLSYTYYKTRLRFLGDNAVDIYLREEGGSIWVKNDRVISFYRPGSKTQGQNEKTRDECFDIAYQFLCQQTDEPDAYVLVEEKNRFETSTTDDPLHRFTFARVINGIITSDQASINVSVYGTIKDWTLYCFGEMKDAVPPSQEELDSILARIGERLEKIHAEVEGKERIVYGTPEITFMRLYNGRYAIEYYVEATLDLGEYPALGITQFLAFLD